MIRWLASAQNIEEVAMLLETGVDIIDLKNPRLGALGALSSRDVSGIVRLVAGRKVTSATIGDLEMSPAILLPAIADMAGTGVDIVKIGFFESPDQHACVNAIGTLANPGAKLVAVLLADQGPDMTLLPVLADAGFYGVMLDTAVKDGRSLLDHMTLARLQSFVASARACGLIAGLAGSLRIEHIDALSSLTPDYLGFRGALCDAHDRAGALNQACIESLQGMLHKNNMHAVNLATA